MKVLLFSLFIFISIGANAQYSLFKPIPKLAKAKTANGKAFMATSVAPNGDSTFFALRPIVSAVNLYIDGDVQLAAGGGLSYQNITQRASDGRNYVNYAINLIIAAGGSVTSDAPKNGIGKAALFISALNNTVGLGGGISRQDKIDPLDPLNPKRKWKGGLAVVWTYNFNN